MKKPPSPAADAATLRRRAETRLREPAAQRGTVPAATDPPRLLHELQVHQIELELQNEELKQANDQLETVLEKYQDLYDFAPVGYFSLDEQGAILEVNLTGAALLGLERSRLIQRRLGPWLAPASRPLFYTFLKKTFATPGLQTCEVALLKTTGAVIWADLEATSAAALPGVGKWCRVAVRDITERKQAQATQRRLDLMAVTNRKLAREIIRRQAVEQDLKQSERRQRQLLRESRVMQEQLRLLSHQILLAQEEERKRISRELHDEISQTLTGITVHLETLSKEAFVNPRGLPRKIARTQRLVEKSVNLVHQFARELRPTVLDDLGLVPALHAYLKDFTRRTGLHVHFKTFAYGKLEQLGGDQRTVLYRVAQEALTNVARHARASLVTINLLKRRNRLWLEIHDDGQGFVVEQVTQAKRFKRLGLLGMRERVEMAGGQLSVTSTPGRGTTIQAQIPFPKGGSS